MADKTIQLVAGIFILLTALGTSYYLTAEDEANLYQCGDVVGLCVKLSSANSLGMQTRCYYNESAPTKYKYCETGWVKSKVSKEVIGTEVTENLPNEEIFETTKMFSDKLSAEEYSKNIVKSKHAYSITRTEQKLGSSEIEIYWILNIFDDEYIIHSEEYSSKFLETATKEEIEATISQHALDVYKQWKPDIKVVKVYE